jgi:hypothetical protein
MVSWPGVFVNETRFLETMGQDFLRVSTAPFFKVLRK